MQSCKFVICCQRQKGKYLQNINHQYMNLNLKLNFLVRWVQKNAYGLQKTDL